MRRSLGHWRLRAEEKQRLLEKKEEAWELFKRQPGNKQTTKENFAQEFKRKVTNMMDGPVGSKVQEKYLLEWTNELRKVAQEEERRLEARETRKMGEEEVQRRAREHEAKRRSLELWHARATEAQRLQDKNGKRGTSTEECRTSDPRRRTSRKTSSTRLCTTARQMNRVCRNG